MVKGVFRFITQEIDGLHAAAYIVAFLTLGSQVLAIVRDRIFATLLGPGEILDYYYAAFKLPDVYFALFASLFSVYVLLPLLSKKNEAGRRHMQKMVGEACILFTIIMGVVALVTFLFREQVATLLFPSFMERETAPIFLTFFSAMLLQPLFLGISGVLASVTQLQRQFFAYAFSPIIYNVGIIVGAFFVPTEGAIALALGVLGGALGALFFNLVVLFKGGVFPILSFPKRELVTYLSIHALPRALALSLSTLTFLVLTIYATTLSLGSVTLFSFAMNVGAVPLTLIGAAYSVAAFPTLAALYVKDELKEFVRRITDAARHVILWSSLAMVLFIVLRAHIVRVIFGTGEFSWVETRLTAALLAVLVVSLIAQALVMLISRGYYAQGKSYLPLIFQGIGFCVTVGLASIGLAIYYSTPWMYDGLTKLLRIDGIIDTRVIVLAGAFSLGHVITMLCAVISFSRRFPRFILPVLRVFIQSIGISIVGGIAAYQILALLGGIFPLTSLSSVLFQGLVAGVGGTAVFLALLFLLGNKEAGEVRAGMRSLVSKRRSLQSVGDAL